MIRTDTQIWNKPVTRATVEKFHKLVGKFTNHGQKPRLIFVNFVLFDLDAIIKIIVIVVVVQKVGKVHLGSRRFASTKCSRRRWHSAGRWRGSNGHRCSGGRSARKLRSVRWVVKEIPLHGRHSIHVQLGSHDLRHSTDGKPCSGRGDDASAHAEGSFRGRRSGGNSKHGPESKIEF